MLEAAVFKLISVTATSLTETSPSPEISLMVVPVIDTAPWFAVVLETAFTTPLLFTVAIVGSLDSQVNSLVMSRLSPLLSIPVALNCNVSPGCKRC